MEQVTITGLGVVSSLGTGTERFWHALCAASSEPGHVHDPHGNYPISLLHRVTDEAAGQVEPGTLGGIELGRASRFAVTAAREAVADAALDQVPPTRLAVVLGTGMGDGELHESWRIQQRKRPYSTLFSLAAAVADDLGVNGPAIVVSNACSASGYAVSVGADMIRTGEVDVVVAGGAEAYTRVALACFNRMGAIDPERCRPFGLHRGGTVFGEGAGVLVLESARHADSRGARPYGRLTGTGWSCDGHHVTAPEPSGEQIRHAMSRALAQADAEPGSVGCVIPHGTGTELNDVVESRALQAVLGGYTDQVPVYSLKALVGHTGGAAAGIAAVAAMLILDRALVPPNLPLDALDPECKIWLPQGEPTPLKPRSVMVNSYAFGGLNSSLLFESEGPRWTASR